MENKKENFKRISENRVSKILALLTQLSNLSNSSFYEYTEDEIERIFGAINSEAQKSKDILLKAAEKRKKKTKFEF